MSASDPHDRLGDAGVHEKDRRRGQGRCAADPAPHNEEPEQSCAQSVQDQIRQAEADQGTGMRDPLQPKRKHRDGMIELRGLAGHRPPQIVQQQHAPTVGTEKGWVPLHQVDVVPHKLAAQARAERRPQKNRRHDQKRRERSAPSIEQPCARDRQRCSRVVPVCHRRHCSADAMVGATSMWA